MSDNKKGGAGEKGKEKPNKRDFGNPGVSGGSYREVLVTCLVAIGLGTLASEYKAELMSSRRNFACLMLLSGNKPNGVRLYGF